VIRDLSNGFAREHLGILMGFFDGAWIVRPPRGDRDRAVLLSYDQFRFALANVVDENEAAVRDVRGAGPRCGRSFRRPPPISIHGRSHLTLAADMCRLDGPGAPRTLG
jgi:hypothetical protein